MGHHPLGRQTARDQPGRRRGLHHPVLAGAAGVFRPAGDEHPVLCRDYVEPRRAVFANHLHDPAAACAGGRLGRDDDLNPRQVLRQRAAAGPARLGAGALEYRIGLLLSGFGFGNGLLDILQCEIKLVGVELFRAPAEPQPLQLADQMAKAIILGGKLGLFGTLGIAFGPGLRQHRAQRGDIVRQRLGSRGHGPIGPCNPRLVVSLGVGESIRRRSPGYLGSRNPRRVHPSPVKTVE